MDRLQCRPMWRCQSARAPKRQRRSKTERGLQTSGKTWIVLHPWTYSTSQLNCADCLNFLAKPEKRRPTLGRAAWPTDAESNRKSSVACTIISFDCQHRLFLWMQCIGYIERCQIL